MNQLRIRMLTLALAASALTLGCAPHNTNTQAQAQDTLPAATGEPLPASPQEIDMTSVQAAQRFRTAAQPVKAQNDTTVIAEAEEFHPVGSTPDGKNSDGKNSGWRALPWGTNYYAATMANTFLSRHAYLSAPAETQNATATITVEVPKAGKYLALVRYEAAPGFQTQFHLKVEQNGQTKLDRLYGARDNLKIWAFGNKLQKEVSWDWGAVENIVWEGQDAAVELQAGTAQLTLIADKQPPPAARRNIDLVMLTSDQAQVENRIQNEGYLPLDGMLTQAGDVYVKVTNHGAAPLTLTVPPGTEHSSYWVHQRDWKPLTIAAAAGQTTDWIEVGSLLDTLNDGQWAIKTQGDSSNYALEFGARDAAGNIGSIHKFDKLSGDVELAYDADTRYARHIQSSAEVLYKLLDYLKKQPIRGQAPKRTLILGYTFDPRPSDAKYTAARDEFIKLTGANALNAGDSGNVPATGPARGYLDVRDKIGDLATLETYLQGFQKDGTAGRIVVVSLGDEISLPAPPKTDTGFGPWLGQQGTGANGVDPAAWSVSEETKKANPQLYYYSNLYGYHYGIERYQQITALLQKYLPNAQIGANYSPHADSPYLGEAHKWVSIFRDGGMTMPWSEDYAWQVPVGTQQMNFLDVDLFRSGIKDKPNAKIQMYVMPHWPGNTPNDWRRMFYGDIMHGVKIFNLYEFRPVQAAYTENHVSLPAMFQEVRRGLYELGTFEDIVQDGQVQPAQTALWFSNAGDIWNDNHPPFGAAKRALYVAICHQQLPLDMVIEGDDLSAYKVLYLADQNVSRAASQRIADWVKNGGHLFATAGAGMFDEFNQPNTILRGVLGVEQKDLTEADAPIRWMKQDLPFAQALDTVKWQGAALPVFGARSRFTAQGAEVQATFGDGSPAIATNKSGKGTATYAGFLPGLTYFKPAIPQRPVDRGSTDDSMAHFIPTEFDASASKLIGLPATALERPVVASNPLVSSSVITAKSGVLIPLVNWSAGPIKNLSLTLSGSTPSQSVTLASGRKVKIEKQDGKTILTFDLDVADALILR